MSIPTPNEYQQELQKVEQRILKKMRSNTQYATVIQLSPLGKPIIQFDGDKLPSSKLYTYLKSYTPIIGERVMLVNDVIQGGIVN